MSIDTTLPATDPLRFRKNLFQSYKIKITVTDQIKILEQNVTQNEVQYDLEIKAAKVSASFSNNLDKYEYLTGEDLDYKPDAVEQPRFEYSQLGKFLNRGLKEEDKKEGFIKRLKNIEDKNDEQLKAFEVQK